MAAQITHTPQESKHAHKYVHASDVFHSAVMPVMYFTVQ